MKSETFSPDDLKYLKEIIAKAETRLREYRKILFIWAVIIPVCGLISHFLIWSARTAIIPYIWVPSILAGAVISHLAARKIREKTRINPLLARYMAILWIGGISVLLVYFGIALASPALSLAYFPAITFPVIGLCILATSALFRIKAGYPTALLFYLCSVPSLLFPEYAMLIQSIVMGAGILVLGISAK
ncbi:MAG: hypothetical protein JW874_04345 [Spirochaetales bacterium]|nr:hypothetical protein [Spirochaetales bacterium]